MSYSSDCKEFIAQFRKEGGQTCEAESIIQHANTLQYIAMRECNVERTDEETAIDNRKEERAQRLIRNYCVRAGAEPSFDGDPRGNVVKLRFKSGVGNCFGDSSLYCVPTKEY